MCGRNPDKIIPRIPDQSSRPGQVIALRADFIQATRARNTDWVSGDLEFQGFSRLHNVLES